MRVIIVLLSVVTAVGAGWVTPTRWAAAEAAAATQTAVGTIDAVGAGMLTLTSAAGAHVQVKTTAETFLLDRVQAKLEDIKVGDFIAVTARKESNGSLTAVSINIFAPALRGRVRNRAAAPSLAYGRCPGLSDRNRGQPL